MSNPNDVFECRWQPSRQLLAAYLIAQALALGSFALADIPFWSRLLGASLCLAHAAWCLPRQILLSHPTAFRGVRRTAEGWQLWSARNGWRPVQLRQDSLALPQVIVLRFRLPEERRVRGLCIPRDALAQDVHRRLRVRLKFSRRRWVAPE
ncbi:protein YgfX [Azotobacter armeniacus]